MQTCNLRQAKTHLSRLIEAAPKHSRQLGLDDGKIVISDDFDAPMPEFEDLFYGDDYGEKDPP